VFFKHLIISVPLKTRTILFLKIPA